MPISLPNRQTLANRMLDRLVAETGDSQIRLPAHPLHILAVATAGALGDFYAALPALVEDVFPLTAQGEALERLAGVWGIKRAPAHRAVGTINVSGAARGLVVFGTRLALDTTLYETTHNTFLDQNGKAKIRTQAVETGLAGNRPGLQNLVFVTPIAGIDSAVTTDENGFFDGAETETDQQLRHRLLIRMRSPAQSGRLEDYRFWAMQRDIHHVPVSRAFARIIDDGRQTVRLLIVTDGASPYGIPEPHALARIQRHVDHVRPPSAIVEIKPPKALKIAVIIEDLAIESGYQLTEVQAAISETLRALFFEEARPGEGMSLESLSQAIAATPGHTHHRLKEPKNPISATGDDLPVFDGVRFL